MSPRRSNGSKQRGGNQEDSPFINLPWGKEQDEAFEKWVGKGGSIAASSSIDELINEGLSIKIGEMNGSNFATIESPSAREKGLKPLLSGWSDTWHEAVLVAYFKWDKLLGRDFGHPMPEATRSRRR